VVSNGVAAADDAAKWAMYIRRRFQSPSSYWDLLYLMGECDKRAVEYETLTAKTKKWWATEQNEIRNLQQQAKALAPWIADLHERTKELIKK
jgi:hypothetical protein